MCAAVPCLKHSLPRERSRQQLVIGDGEIVTEPLGETRLDGSCFRSSLSFGKLSTRYETALRTSKNASTASQIDKTKMNSRMIARQRATMADATNSTAAIVFRIAEDSASGSKNDTDAASSNDDIWPTCPVSGRPSMTNSNRTSPKKDFCWQPN